MAGRVWLITATWLLVLPGCVTLGRFESLQERVVILEREKDLLSDQIQKDVQRLEELQRVLQEAEKSLRSAAANNGSSLDDLRMDQAKLGGRMDEVQHSQANQEQQLQLILDVLDERLGASALFAPPDLPEDRGQLWALAQQRYDQKMMRIARAIFRIYNQRYPDDAQADDALFMVAESYSSEQKWAAAMRAHQAFYDKYPKSELAPKSLLHIADSLEQQRACKKAMGVLQLLRDTFRKGPEADQAGERLKVLKKDCK